MQLPSIRALLIAVLVFFFASTVLAQSSSLVPSHAKTAEQVYQDIQVFKGMPADQLMPTMQFMNIALGVECEHCHLPGNYASVNANKTFAREMIKMQDGLTNGIFDNVRRVTCWTCHRGSVEPPTLPVVASGSTPVSLPDQRQRVTITADQVFDNWIKALGGADALQKISTRRESGTITVGEMKSPIEVLIKSPGKRMSIARAPDGQSITAFDGQAGWLGTVGRPAHEMDSQENYAAMLDAAFASPLTARRAFQRIRMWKPAKVNGRETNVVLGIRSDQAEVMIYFDKDTSLLVHMTRFVETPIGRIPTEIDYADYRTVDGVQVPYRWTIARPQGSFTIQIDRVEDNVPIDDSRFAKPAGLVSAGAAQR